MSFADERGARDFAESVPVVNDRDDVPVPWLTFIAWDWVEMNFRQDLTEVDRRVRTHQPALYTGPEGQRIGIGEVDPGRLAANIVQIVETRKLHRVPGILEIFNDEFLPPINERITSLGR